MPVVSSSVRRPSLTWRDLEINVVIAESAEDTKKKKGRGTFLFRGNDTFLLEQSRESWRCSTINRRCDSPSRMIYNRRKENFYVDEFIWSYFMQWLFLTSKFNTLLYWKNFGMTKWKWKKMAKYSNRLYKNWFSFLDNDIAGSKYIQKPSTYI